MAERGEAPFPIFWRPCAGVVCSEDEAAREVISGTASAVRVTIVAHAPPCGVLMEPVVGDFCGPRGGGESDSLAREAVRAQPELLPPAVDTEPACINGSVSPTRGDAVVGQVPGGLNELALEGSVTVLIAVVA